MVCIDDSENVDANIFLMERCITYICPLPQCSPWTARSPIVSVPSAVLQSGRLITHYYHLRTLSCLVVRRWWCQASSHGVSRWIETNCCWWKESFCAKTASPILFSGVLCGLPVPWKASGLWMVLRDLLSTGAGPRLSAASGDSIQCSICARTEWKWIQRSALSVR